MDAIKTSAIPQNLRPRARLIRTIGEELISNEMVAIVELVKNAYDADATKVLIRFSGPLNPGDGVIEVIDNGRGMDLNVLSSIWMEPATPSKRGEKRRSPRYLRRYLGEKGIGRFASSRLAKDLEIFSRVENSAKEAFGIFDWSQFDDEKKYLDEICFLWEERIPTEITPGGTIDLLWEKEAVMPPPEERTNGTILRMVGLKQKWEVRQFENLRRVLARLIVPSSDSPQKSGSDPGFEVSISVPSEFAQFNSRISPPAILNHPHYIVSGSIKQDGSYQIRHRLLAKNIDKIVEGRFIRIFDSKKRSLVRAISAQSIKKDGLPTSAREIECGPVTFSFSVWDRDELGDIISGEGSSIQNIRRDLDAMAGINVYRDEFRVLPYGEPQNDWLRLDIRRVQKPTVRLSNNQIYGAIHITSDENPGLKDQSNREGFDENQSLCDLREVLIEILNQFEQARWEVRPRNTAKPGTSEGGLFSGLDFQDLNQYLKSKFPHDQETHEAVRRTAQIFDRKIKEIQNVLSRYQRLSTLGQLIDHVLHEGGTPIAAIKNEAILGSRDCQKAETDEMQKVERALRRFNVIRDQGDVLAMAFKRLEPFGGRRQGRPAQFYLEDVIRDTFDVFSSDIESLGVVLELPSTKTLARIDSTELREIVINLLQNSIYWLAQVEEGKRSICVKIQRLDSEHLEMLFADSGPGIPEENRERIFEPYFSTKPQGIGLGLFIIGEIISDYYLGSLELLQNGPLPGANFLITLKKRV